MKHPGHTYGGFISAISERGMTLSKAPQSLHHFALIPLGSVGFPYWTTSIMGNMPAHRLFFFLWPLFHICLYFDDVTCPTMPLQSALHSQRSVIGYFNVESSHPPMHNQGQLLNVRPFMIDRGRCLIRFNAIRIAFPFTTRITFPFINKWKRIKRRNG
jgi:hypothetical protein